MRRGRRIAAWCAASLAVLAGAPALAQSDEAERRAAAQALFDDATRRLDARDYAAACPKLEEVVRLQPGKIGAMMALAECYEGMGRLASAWSRYRAGADVARAAGDARAPALDAKVAALEARLPVLVVIVPEGAREAAGLELTCDGTVLGEVQWGSPIPLDPGDRAVRASAPGRRAWSAVVKLVPGQRTAVTIPALEEESAPAVAASPIGPRVVAPAVRPVRDEGGSFDPPGWTLVVGSAGLVALGVGTGFGISGLAAQSDLDARCNERRECPGYDPTDDNARKNRGLGLFLGLGGAGAAALTTAIVAAVLHAPEGVAGARVAIGPRGAALSLGGAF